MRFPRFVSAAAAALLAVASPTFAAVNPAPPGDHITTVAVDATLTPKDYFSINDSGAYAVRLSARPTGGGIAPIQASVTSHSTDLFSGFAFSPRQAVAAGGGSVYI